MPTPRRTYPPEFRQQLVELVWAGRTPEELSREFENRMRQSLFRAGSLGILFVLWGCPERSAIWILPGSTAESLEFGIGRARGDTIPIDIGALRVSPCAGPFTGEGAYWAVAVESPTAPAIGRVRYGEAPVGSQVTQGPIALTPGCYRASISGTGSTEFVIEDDGRVVERPPEPPGHDPGGRPASRVAASRTATSSARFEVPRAKPCTLADSVLVPVGLRIVPARVPVPARLAARSGLDRAAPGRAGPCSRTYARYRVGPK
jgi:hypothetical protein